MPKSTVKGPPTKSKKAAKIKAGTQQQQQVGCSMPGVPSGKFAGSVVSGSAPAPESLPLPKFLRCAAGSKSVHTVTATGTLRTAEMKAALKKTDHLQAAVNVAGVDQKPASCGGGGSSVTAPAC